MGQQKSSGIRVKPDSGRNSCNPCDKGRFKGILQQQGRVKMVLSQFPGQPVYSGNAPVSAPLGFIHEDDIDIRAVFKNRDHPGFGQDTDFGMGKRFSNGVNGRCRHYCIPDPVC